MFTLVTFTLVLFSTIQYYLKCSKVEKTFGNRRTKRTLQCYSQNYSHNHSLKTLYTTISLQDRPLGPSILHTLDFKGIFFIPTKWIIHRPYGRQYRSDIWGVVMDKVVTEWWSESDKQNLRSPLLDKKKVFVNISLGIGHARSHVQSLNATVRAISVSWYIETL